jgi:hypothetical protein
MMNSNEGSVQALIVNEFESFATCFLKCHDSKLSNCVKYLKVKQNKVPQNDHKC